MLIRRQIGFQVLAVLALAGPPIVAFASAVPEVKLEVDEMRLDNGVTLLFVERPSAPDVAAGWVVRAGSADDPADRRGLAHVLEHMMFKGSEVIGSRDYAAESSASREVDELRKDLGELRGRGKGDGRRAVELEARIDELEARLGRLVRPGEFALRYSEAGASALNGFTFEDFTLYFIRLPPGKLELWFWLESDRLIRPVFRDFEREKGVIRQEVRQRIDSQPTGRADDAVRRAFWGDSSYAWRALGDPEDFARVERSEAERFFSENYAADRLTAVLVGPFDRQEARRLARTYFARLPGRTPGETPPPRATRPAAPSLDGPIEASCDCPRQARVHYPTVPYRHPDSYALQVLAGVFNGRTGRLYRSLVLDRRIAFSATATQLSYRDAGGFVFAAETKGETGAEELVRAWDAELEKLRREPVTAGELRKVKNQLIASSLRGLRRPTDLARQLLVYAGLGEWRQITDWPRRIDEVSAEDVRRVARGLDDENRLVAHYRPEGDGPDGRDRR